MKKILIPLTLLFSLTAFSQQTPTLEKHVYDNIHHEEQLKPATKIPNQARFALIDKDSKNYDNKNYGLTPKYWLTLSYPNLKMIDPFPEEQAMLRKPDHKYGVDNKVDNKYGIFHLHTPILKKNAAELMFPY